VRRRLLTRDELRVVRVAWIAGETQGEIAARVGISIDTFRARLADQLSRLPPRPRRSASGRRTRDPTEEEIYGRLTLIEQSSWTDEERERRWRGYS
jgi:hypothetical protein